MQQRCIDTVTVFDVAVEAYLLYMPAFLPQVYSTCCCGVLLVELVHRWVSSDVTTSLNASAAQHTYLRPTLLHTLSQLPQQHDRRQCSNLQRRIVSDMAVRACTHTCCAYKH
jgi:hypothetical protein